MVANASMSVTPGSETLWSVHSGQRCWTRRLASSTRSWKRRSSRLGAKAHVRTTSRAGAPLPAPVSEPASAGIT